MAAFAYYNENNPHAAGWLRNLISVGIIPPGDVDERDIRDVCAADLGGYTQCHFFAGIGLWPYACRLAGWPDDRPVWSGSCPCQPFSAAGKRGGFTDERHLWPSWYWLIGQCRPRVVFGEQVASPDGVMWFDVVSSDMEGSGYACGAVDFPSAGIGAPNIRQRLWWVADGGGMGNAGDTGLPDAESQAMESAGRRCQGRAAQQPGCAFDPWSEPEWIACTDGKRRPTQPGLFPLAARHPGDVGKLRAYGNAINPEVAAEIIASYMDLHRIY